MAGKKLVAFGKMPDRATSGERIAMMRADMEAVTGELRRTLTDKSMEFNVRGYVLDEESWEFAVNGRTVIGMVVTRRAD